MKHLLFTRILVGITLLALMLGAIDITSAYAAGPIVTKTADTNDGVCDSDCSLREALVAAAADDTITFAAGLSGQTITLSSKLSLSKNITINGSALLAKIVISGNNNVQVLSVDSGVTATLNSLSITKGIAQYGGGVYNNGGTLNVINCTFPINSAFGGGGIYNRSGTLNVTNSTLTGNSASYGGGIYNQSGTLNIMDSTFSDNVASGGGGIYSLGSVTVTNSTFSANIATAPLGGSNGGGINSNLGSTLIVTNSTFSDNSAAVGGGIINFSNAAVITNSTFSANSGSGVYNNFGHTITIRNSTFSGNSAETAQGGADVNNAGTLNYANTIFANSVLGFDCVNEPEGTIGTNTNNLVEDNSCSPALSGDPDLGPLASNGGSTQTHALLAASKAIDAGDNTICAAAPVNNFDQRGEARPFDGDLTPGAICDIGSYEFTQAAPTATVTSTATSTVVATVTSTPTVTPTHTAVACSAAIVVASNANSGMGTLRQALADICPGGTITFAAGLSGQTIILQSKLIISKNTVINGSSLVSKIGIDGDNDDTVWFIDSSVTATLNSLIITRGSAEYGGGVYNNGGTLNVINCTFSVNSAFEGGGIYNDSGTLNVTNSMFSGNYAPYGGGISNHGTLNIVASTLSGNSAAAGGGIFSNFGKVTVINSTFLHNDTDPLGNGGGINNNLGSTLIVMNSTFSNNSSGVGGGIINDGTVTITNSTFSANSGSGVHNNFGRTLTIRSSTFSGNSAASAENGAAINNLGKLNYVNTILANSVLGFDCVNEPEGTIGTNTNNLVEDNSCSPALHGDPKLGPLASNGGSTKTHALLPGSSALNAGNDAICAAAPVSNTSQNGLARPQGTHCDIGAYESQTFLITAINQAVGQVDPVSVAPIHFTAVFSEGVTGFTGSDLSFSGTTLTGMLAATVTEIAPMNGTRYDVAISGMIPFGIVKVSIPAGRVNSASRPSVVNQASNSTDNQVTFDYILAEFGSNASQDGWVLESTETSGVGGSVNRNAMTISVGDDASNRQYRGVLDFATASLPDNAVIGVVNLRIIQSSVTGINPFTTHGLLKSEIKTGFFGSTGTLQAVDFAFAPDKLACEFEAVPEMIESLGTAYRCVVLASAFPAINLTGSTQFRLRFTLDDNNNMSADTFNFYSGDFSSWSQRPRLFIKYYIPPVP